MTELGVEQPDAILEILTSVFLASWAPNWQESFVLDNILTPWAVMQERCMWRVYSLKFRIQSGVEIPS